MWVSVLADSITLPFTFEYRIPPQEPITYDLTKFNQISEDLKITEITEIGNHNGYQKQKNYFDGDQTIGTFWGQVSATL